MRCKWQELVQYTCIRTLNNNFIYMPWCNKEQRNALIMLNKYTYKTHKYIYSH